MPQSDRGELPASSPTISLNRCGNDSFRASSHRYNPIVPTAVARKIETDKKRIKDPPVSDLDPDDLANDKKAEDLHDHGDANHDFPGLFDP